MTHVPPVPATGASTGKTGAFGEPMQLREVMCPCYAKAVTLAAARCKAMNNQIRGLGGVGSHL